MAVTPGQASTAGVPNAPPQGSALARHLFAAYALLVVYASLHPFTGWRDHGLSGFEFLWAAWPRYITAFDVVGNVLGYLPFGFLAVLALYGRVAGTPALALAVAGGLLLSLALEAAQTFLPARIASNLDVICNLAGSALGALTGTLTAAWLLEGGPLRRLRSWAFESGSRMDLGLVIVALWLFAQLNPATLLFGTGSLRDWFGLLDIAAPVDGATRPAELFISIEASTAAVNLAAAALLLSALVAPGRPARLFVVLLVLAALAVKTVAFAIVLQAENTLAWATPGAMQGLVAGLLIALAGVELPRAARLMAAAVLLMVGAVLVNLAPPNPYLAATQALWKHGHFLNFNGLTRLVSTLWPYAVLAYLVSLASRRDNAADRGGGDRFG